VGNVDVSGRIRVFPEQTTEYTVEAEGKGGTVNKTIVLDVTSSLPGAGILEEDLARATIEEQFAAMVKPVYFGFDSAQLSPEALKILDGNLQWLSLPQNQAIQFVIEGHADERGSEEYNLALGDARAEAAAEYLRKGGIDPSRIATVSLGEERPFDSGKTEAAYAQNRRAQFVLLKTQ
jgi:peptidoglycan-associated lipoprotein